MIERSLAGIDPFGRAGVLLPLLLVPLLAGALREPAFRATMGIDGPWEAACLAISGLGIILRMLVAGHARQPAAGLAATGLHSVVRHPLVLGNILIWLGLALFPRSWHALLACAAVLWLAYRPGMARQDLAWRLGAGLAHDRWARRTPALLPAWRQWRPAAAPFSWKAALVRERTTLFATIAAFFLLEVAGDVIVGEPLHLETAWAALLGAGATVWVGAWLAIPSAPAAPADPRAATGWPPPVGLAVAAVCLLAWDASGADLVLARLVGSPHGFALRDHWLASDVLHSGMRLAVWGAVTWMAVSLRWPTGVVRNLERRERVWLLGTVLLSLLAVNAIKHWSQTSCPWDLREFGGSVDHVSHWLWNIADGGPGHCFPAGHASAGFAFIAGAFALRRSQPRAARVWLAIALLAGLVMGLAQQLRGAHFASHTLWSAWLCWACAWLSAKAFLRPEGRP